MMAHVGARPTDPLTLRAGTPIALADWRGVAHWRVRSLGALAALASLVGASPIPRPG
jgi:hypothetical protein